MDLVYSWAEELGPPPMISSSEEPRFIAKFVDFVDKTIFANSEFWKFSLAEKRKFLKDIAEKTKSRFGDISDGNQRINLALRLWASCLFAAKTMRKTYVTVNPDGSLGEKFYTPQMRQDTFRNYIDPIASGDKIYRLGVAG